jgi:hypothetical protein
MALRKSERVPEKVFTIAMWVVSVVFAGFLIGLGNLVLGDLPRVETNLSQEQFLDQAALARLRGQQTDLDSKLSGIDSKLQVARLALEQTQKESNNAQDVFDTWVRTRVATSNPDQDPELIARTRVVEAVKAKERVAQQALDRLDSERLTLEQRRDSASIEQSNLNEAAFPAYEKSLFWQELRVFLWRLLFTLPLLLIAAWLVMKKRKSDYWPLMRGFVLAAAFAFFVELVPYLPSYGGYIRYIVGIVLTGFAGHFLIRNMRAYLDRRQVAEAQEEVERRKLVSHEEAFKKMAANVCPGCDRPVATTGDVAVNFCVHCGMTLFDNCTGCNTRKMAFFRYCMSCGTPAQPEQVPKPLTV